MDTQTFFRELREKHGWSQEQMARELNVTQVMISRVERADKGFRIVDEVAS